jgi:vacuolar protein sorting-associated protein 54
VKVLTVSRMLRDAEWFKTRIGGIDGAGDTGDYLINLVKEKNVPKSREEPKPEPTPAVKELEAAQTNGKTSIEARNETTTGEVNGTGKQMEENGIPQVGEKVEA